MRKTKKIWFGIFCAAALAVLLTGLGACDVFSPDSKVLTSEEAAVYEASFIEIPLRAGENSVDVCCSSPTASEADPNNIIDGNVSTFWGTNYNAAAPSDSFWGPHYVNIDLGMVYDNVARVEYVPSWLWSGPGGYDGSWANGPAGVVNNGLVTSFEIYLTEEPLKHGETPPAERRAAYGSWYALESGSNTIINTGAMRFTATFNSARGRYLQFRILSGYRNHWASNLSAIGQIAELRISRTRRPFTVNTAGLQDALNKANVLRAAYPARYGYTNAILTNWGGKAESYLNKPGDITQESVDYIRTNLMDYVKLAGQRIGETTYDRFVPKILWADDQGNHLQAHGGGTLWDPVGQKWWFYGEDRASNTTGGGQPGVHAYSSTDLYNWKDEGLALPIFNNTVYDESDWREASSVASSGFQGGWDGNRRNDSGANPAASATAPHVSGFMWAVNKWRQSLGDWNADGFIEEGGEYYPNGRLTSITNANSYVVDDPTDPASLRGPLSSAAQTVMWNTIKDHIPGGNPPLYIDSSPSAKPYPTALGLTAAKIDELNALYRDIPVWRRKQLYRFWNYTTTVERPKVIFNGGQGEYKTGTGTHALTGNPIEPYEDSTGVYPYVMFVHIEGGVTGIGYGTAKVVIAVAKNPAGPFKLLWAYHKHFAEGVSYSTDHLGMSRDQSVLVDDDGTAYHFGSTQENRIMGIDILNESYTQIIGVPRFTAGESQDQLHEEGYDNQLGTYFNFVYSNQREAPAPFLHYITQGMTYEGVVEADGTISAPPATAQKYYYMASSTSTGWFPNAQGVYRVSQPGGRILGRVGHSKPAMGSGNTDSNSTGEGSAPGTGVNGTGWIAIAGNGYTDNGANGSFCFGVADDGSHVSKGYDGQTTYVQQLRYPAYKWGIIGFRDEDYVPPDASSYADAEAYYTALTDLYTANTYVLPVYGETEIPEPRVGKLVYGKYIYLSDSWDSTKNYDARYIWLPMRVVPNGTENTNAARGARARWMKEWRWQDFVYDLGPFANSLTAAPPAVKDSTTVQGSPTATTSPSMWTLAGIDHPQNLLDYYEMLETSFGSSADWYLNPGKQNPGQDWLKEWLE
jgi:hypothetical protein